MRTRPTLLLALVLFIYTALGALYAVYTPSWQVPDEPAHYNVIRALAEKSALPVMEMGDYDQAYLEQLTGQGFPASLPIDAVTYEDHQPPLYYLLALPVYWLFDGALLPLRLVSVTLGTTLLAVTFALARTLFPERPALALATATLAGFIPQHLAMSAGVENDLLAELLVGLTLWLAVRHLRAETPDRRTVPLLGLVVGLALLTKTSAYITLPLALLAVALRARRDGWSRSTLRRAALQGAGIVLLALLLAGPWLVRNVCIYGWSDPLALARHNAVVAGQPRSVEWLALYGWGGLAARLLRTTFQSFWGQFGWMAVPFHPPVYLALGVVSATLAGGFLGWLVDHRRQPLTPPQRDGLLLLAVSALLTLAAYLWYNLTFVQHQGRYLFPALIPLALAAALGLEWLLAPRIARWAAAALAALGALLAAWGLACGDLPLTPLATVWGLAALCGMTARWGAWLTAVALFAALLALDLYALFGAIVPSLAP